MHSYFTNGRLSRLCLKELRESLRDRRTIITLILMPILVYPLLSMALQRLIIGSARNLGATSTEFVVGVPDEATAAVLQTALNETQQAADAGIQPAIEIVRPKSGALPSLNEGPASKDQDVALSAISKAAFRFFVPEKMTVSQALRTGELDLAVLSASVVRTVDAKGRPTPAYQFELEFRDADLRSEESMLEFRKAMQLVNDFQAANLRGTGVPPKVQLIAAAISRKIDPTASLAGVLPLVLILMTITGAVYPAIDLTAGERERGTMEAMIATPAPRFVLLLSKYVAVVTVAVLTALANLFASWVTLSLGGLGQALLGNRGFSLLVLIQILPLLIIFAAFFSAILLAMCSFARSFKEAQAYLIPVMLVSLAPALVTLMPNVEFSTLLGIVPLVNILLLSRDIMTGTPSALAAFAAVLSTLLYAAAALVVASRLFGGESATAGSQETWSDLLRRPRKLRIQPDLGELAVYLALLFPLFFVVTNIAGQQATSLMARIWCNAAILIILFGLLPIIFCVYRRLSLSDTFLLRGVDQHRTRYRFPGAIRVLGALIAGGLLGIGMWILAFEALKYLSDLGFGELTIERSDALEELKRGFRELPLWMVLFTSALVPAVVEEFFFRGFVLSAFRGRTSKTRAVIYSSLLFAVFHVVTGSVLSIERFVPTFLLGVALGTLAVQSGVLWPGILAHAIHNGLLFWLTRFRPEELQDWLGTTNEHFPLLWVVASLAAVSIGFLALFFTHTRDVHESTT